jgi:hypothetical protein
MKVSTFDNTKHNKCYATCYVIYYDLYCNPLPFYNHIYCDKFHSGIASFWNIEGLCCKPIYRHQPYCLSSHLAMSWIPYLARKEGLGGLSSGALGHYQQYFSYIVAVRFIGGAGVHGVSLHGKQKIAELFLKKQLIIRITHFLGCL